MPALLLVLGTSACSKPEDPAPPAPEPPEVQAFRQEVDALLRGAKSLTLVSEGPIPDGGSRVVELRTDAGTPLYLQARHQNRDLGGSQGAQVFLFFDRRVEIRLPRGSAPEERLLGLLETATAAPSERTALERLKTSLRRRTPFNPRQARYSRPKPLSRDIIRHGERAPGGRGL